jgi:glyoxylase-like metal-dependent hydrolase (beta-lactamase superfamily II)
MILRDMGKAGLAIMVLGTAACSTDPTDNATPTEEPATSTGPPDPTTTTAAAAASTTSTTSPPAGHDWHRVDLDFVSAYILYRGGEAALVDTGVRGSEASIEAALGEIGLGWGDVGHLIVTHRHPDHQGSVEAVITASGAPWYAGAGDIDAVTASTDGVSVGDGDTVFDLQIIETPGHTPGHIAVLDPLSGVLVAGDAINGENGGVAGPNAQFSEDMDLANASVSKLAGFEYEIALFGHGEPVVGGASSQVAALAESLG